MVPPQDHGQPAHLSDRSGFALRRQAHGRVSRPGRAARALPGRAPDAERPDDEALRRHRIPDPQDAGPGDHLPPAQRRPCARGPTHRMDPLVPEGLGAFQRSAERTRPVPSAQWRGPGPDHPLAARRDGPPALPGRDGPRAPGCPRGHRRDGRGASDPGGPRRRHPEAPDLPPTPGRHRVAGGGIPTGSADRSGDPARHRSRPRRRAPAQCQRHAADTHGPVVPGIHARRAQLLHRPRHPPAMLPTGRDPRHHHLAHLPAEGQAGDRPAGGGGDPLPFPGGPPDPDRRSRQGGDLAEARRALRNRPEGPAPRIRSGPNPGRDPLHLGIRGHPQGRGAHPRQPAGQHPPDGRLPRHLRP